eukprot:1788805-Rhodomonas_salina.1
MPATVLFLAVAVHKISQPGSEFSRLPRKTSGSGTDFGCGVETQVVNPHDTYNFNRRGSRASIADSSSSMDLLYNRAQTPLQPTSLGI